MLAENGDLDGAREAYRRAVSFGTVEITNGAAHRTEAPHPGASLKSPERDKAITTAALQLGILLAQEGDLNGARAAYQHAVDFGHTDMAPWPMVKLAIALIEHADMETAQAALQRALDTPSRRRRLPRPREPARPPRRCRNCSHCLPASDRFWESRASRCRLAGARVAAGRPWRRRGRTRCLPACGPLRICPNRRGGSSELAGTPLAWQACESPLGRTSHHGAVQHKRHPLTA